MENNDQIHQLSGVTRGRHYTAKGQTIGRKSLVNKLNYINFQNETILVNFKHTRYQTELSLRAKPLPCLGDTLDCEWVANGNKPLSFSPYALNAVFIPDGRRLLMVKPERFSLNKLGIRFMIPEKCIDVSSRKAKRFLCKNINVRMNQNSAVFQGRLIDFHPTSFRIELDALPPQMFSWVNPEMPVHIILSENEETLYTGQCRIITQSGGTKTRSYVIEPLCHRIRRFRPKEFRNTRQKLYPPPDFTFTHPFTKKVITFTVIDIAGSGFSVEEDQDTAVLLPGMIIPNATLNFANGFSVRCKVQVVYKTFFDEKRNEQQLKCGMAIIDIHTNDHEKMLSLLYRAEDAHAYLGNQVPTDDILKFFFETGFIYPEKYALINEQKEQIKDTYEKLYNQSPEIARHFIYQDRGRILGHMAFIRFYKKAWMIHHHAAGGKGSLTAGFRVLYQIGRFVNDSHELYSTHMDFAFCYYRPGNNFPERVFGSVAESIKDPKKCSLDTFAYFVLPKTSLQNMTLNAPWSLEKAEFQDFFELKQFYEFKSGGLMVDALEIDQHSERIEELAEAYERVGLKREKYIFALKYEGCLKAMLVVNVSNIGLNLSELTNSVLVIVLDTNGLSKHVLFSAFSILAGKFEIKGIPILLFPVTHAGEFQISTLKLYNLWVMNLQYTDQYFGAIQRFFRKSKPC